MLVDDFDPWRQRVRSILEDSSSFRVIAEASDGQEAVEKAATLLPDIVLLDVSIPLINGIEVAKRIKQACPRSKIIFLSQQNDGEVRSAALATGAEAFLLKSRAARDLVPTIEAALLDGLEVYEPIPRPSYVHAGTRNRPIPRPLCDPLTSLWRRFPITIITLGIVMVAWTYHHLEEPTSVDLRTARSSGASQSAPFASPKPPLGIHPLDRRTVGRAKEPKATLSAFKRIQVGPNELDYIAEDVTMRVFTPRPPRTLAQRAKKEVSVGEDVTVRYFASEPATRSQARPLRR
jgi:DNA-binding NarL/FixJ family response regulator